MNLIDKHMSHLIINDFILKSMYLKRILYIYKVTTTQITQWMEKENVLIVFHTKCKFYAMRQLSDVNLWFVTVYIVCSIN